MTHIDIKVAGAAIVSTRKEGLLTAGMVGATATFAFDASWGGLSKIAVFRCGGVTKDQVMSGSTADIPWEVLRRGGILYVGVEGRNGDGSLVIPTVWARAGTVHDGANASGDPSTDPGPPVWAQILAVIGELVDLKTVDKSSIVAAVNEVLSKSGGAVDEAEVQRMVEEYLAQHPLEVTESDPTVPDWAKQKTKPSYTADEVGAIPVPETATVGQTIMVKEVDDDGKPVSWACADSGIKNYRLIRTITVPEDVSTDTSDIEWLMSTKESHPDKPYGFVFSVDNDGNAFALRELYILMYVGDYENNYFGVSDQNGAHGGYGNLGYHRISNSLARRTIHILTLGAHSLFEGYSAALTSSSSGIFQYRNTRQQNTDITSLYIGLFSNNALLAGSTFEIWGR